MMGPRHTRIIATPACYPPRVYRLRLRVVAGIIVAGLAAACREAPAPSVDKNTASSAIAPPRALSIGDLAPEFSLPGSDGKQYSLASYRGRQAVILAWFSKAFSEG